MPKTMTLLQEGENQMFISEMQVENGSYGKQVKITLTSPEQENVKGWLSIPIQGDTEASKFLKSWSSFMQPFDKILSTIGKTVNDADLCVDDEVQHVENVVRVINTNCLNKLGWTPLTRNDKGYLRFPGKYEGDFWAVNREDLKYNFREKKKNVVDGDTNIVVIS